MGTKSFAMTFKMWPSIENIWSNKLAHVMFIYFDGSAGSRTARESRSLEVAYLDGFGPSIDQAKPVDIATIESEFGSCSITKALSVITSSLFSTIESVPPIDEVVV